MRTNFQLRLRSTLGQALAAALLGLAFAGPASSAPSLAGPSVSMDRSAQAFEGRGFVRNAALAVEVRAPDGSIAQYGVVADGRGVLRFNVSPTMNGAHQLRVLDSGGKELARAVLNAH